MDSQILAEFVTLCLPCLGVALTSMNSQAMYTEYCGYGKLMLNIFENTIYMRGYQKVLEFT